MKQASAKSLDIESHFQNEELTSKPLKNSLATNLRSVVCFAVIASGSCSSSIARSWGAVLYWFLGPLRRVHFVIGETIMNGRGSSGRPASSLFSNSTRNSLQFHISILCDGSGVQMINLPLLHPLRRHSPGVMPWRARKARVKWEGSAKPASRAIVASGRWAEPGWRSMRVAAFRRWLIR